jgi:hypothetical protein
VTAQEMDPFKSLVTRIPSPAPVLVMMELLTVPDIVFPVNPVINIMACDDADTTSIMFETVCVIVPAK